MLFAGIMKNRFAKLNQMLTDNKLTKLETKRDLRKMILLHLDLLR